MQFVRRETIVLFTPIYPSFLISFGLNNIALHNLFVRSLLWPVTKTSDNNKLTSINTYYVTDFANKAVTNDTVVGVRLKTLGVYCYEDLSAVGKLLIFLFSHLEKTAG
jgi:hypothetical protein